MTVSIRQLHKIIRKIKLTSNSVLLIKSDSSLATPESMRSFVAAMNQAGLSGVVLIVADKLDDLDEMGLQKMRRAGWVRLKDLSGLRRLVPLPEKELPSSGTGDES